MRVRHNRQNTVRHNIILKKEVSNHLTIHSHLITSRLLNKSENLNRQWSVKMLRNLQWLIDREVLMEVIDQPRDNSQSISHQPSRIYNNHHRKPQKYQSLLSQNSHKGHDRQIFHHIDLQWLVVDHRPRPQLPLRRKKDQSSMRPQQRLYLKDQLNLTPTCQIKHNKSTLKSYRKKLKMLSGQQIFKTKADLILKSLRSVYSIWTIFPIPRLNYSMVIEEARLMTIRLKTP